MIEYLVRLWINNSDLLFTIFIGASNLCTDGDKSPDSDRRIRKDFDSCCTIVTRLGIAK